MADMPLGIVHKRKQGRNKKLSEGKSLAYEQNVVYNMTNKRSGNTLFKPWGCGCFFLPNRCLLT